MQHCVCAWGLGSQRLCNSDERSEETGSFHKGRTHTTTFATGRAYDTSKFPMAYAGLGAAKAKMEDPSSSSPSYKPKVMKEPFGCVLDETTKVGDATARQPACNSVRQPNVCEKS
jgi:hypothetical protein